MTAPPLAPVPDEHPRVLATADGTWDIARYGSDTHPTWGVRRRTPAGLMILVGGRHPTPEAAAAAYPDLWEAP